MKTGFAELPTEAKLHFEEHGTGEPLIVIHGFLGTARDEMGSVIDWLSDRYHVYGVTLRGYGKSEPKPRTFPTDFYERDLADVMAFMDHQKIEKAHFLGFSDGGEIGLLAAGLHPDRFFSVVVWGAIGYFGPAVREEALKYYPATWVKDHVKARHGIGDPNPIVKEWMEAIVAMVDAGGDISLHLADKMTVPLLLLLGEKDYLNPPKYARMIVDRAANARLGMHPCGHEIHDDDWEGFTKVVGEFLESLS